MFLKSFSKWFIYAARNRNSALLKTLVVSSEKCDCSKLPLQEVGGKIHYKCSLYSYNSLLQGFLFFIFFIFLRLSIPRAVLLGNCLHTRICMCNRIQDCYLIMNIFFFLFHQIYRTNAT